MRDAHTTRARSQLISRARSVASGPVCVFARVHASVREYSRSENGNKSCGISPYSLIHILSSISQPDFKNIWNELIFTSVLSRMNSVVF